MTTQEEILYLQQQKLEIHRRAKVLYNRVSRLQAELHQAEDKYNRERFNFESIDRKLSMIDGRHKVLPPEGQRKQKKTEANGLQFTNAQILAIAEVLGVEIEVEGKD